MAHAVHAPSSSYPRSIYVRHETWRYGAAIVVLALSEHQNSILIKLNFAMVKSIR